MRGSNETAAPVGPEAAEASQDRNSTLRRNENTGESKPGRTKIDLLAIAEPIARRLRNDFIRVLPPKTLWFYSDGDNLLYVYLENGSWRNQEIDDGRGILKLIMLECRFRFKKEAIAWLRQQGFVPDDWKNIQPPGSSHDDACRAALSYNQIKKFVGDRIGAANNGILGGLVRHWEDTECGKERDPDEPCFEIVHLKTSNEQYQIKTFCLHCRDCLGHVLPKKWFTKKQLAELRLERTNNPDNSLDECECCHGLAFCEWHHWAPREFFGEDCERWPTSVLCQECHVLWHRTMNQTRRQP